MNYKLRVARERKHWSMEAAAAAVGISKTTFLRWESGEQIPHGSTLDMLCRAFSMSDEDLGYPRGKLETSSMATLTPEQGTCVSPTSNLLLAHQAFALFFEPSTSVQEDASVGASSATLTVPEQPAALVKPDLLNPPVASHLSAWSFLVQDRVIIEKHQMLYVFMEGEIMTMVLRWKLSVGSLNSLQQSVYEAIRTHDAMQNNQTQDAKISRRHALQAIALFPIQAYGLTHLVGEKRSLPSPDELLPSCAAGLVACQQLRQYEPDGVQTIRQILAAYLPPLEHYARSSSPFQQHAAHLTAQSYLLISIIADHYGKLDQMEAASRLARYYAQIAQDPNLEASALTRLAVKFDYEYHDVKALETYHEALALPEFDKVSPLLQGRIYAGLAGVSAICGKRQDALSFLSMARETFPQRPEEDASFRFAYCVQSHLPLWEGLTYKHTGDYAKAIEAFSRFGALTPIAGNLENYRSEHLNYAASVALKQRDLDAAFLYLDTAEEIAWSIQHEQRQAEVRDTLRGMQLLWPQEPKVKALQEKLHERRF